MPVRILGFALTFAAILFVHASAAQEKKLEPKVEPVPIAAPYKTSAKALEAKEEVVKEADNHTQYRVEFAGVKDDRVPAYLYVPKGKGAKPPYPAILLQYGSGGNKTTNYIVEIGKQFVARGYVVITIDSPNQG